jgi:putative peptidoglycan lipid II flippase
MKTLSIIWPVFFISCINDINKLIDKALASNLTAGALSALTYSSKINTLFLGIFITSITTVIFPLMSKAANANDNYKSYKSLIVKGVDTVFAITLPCVTALIAVGYLIVQILYQRGSFSVSDTVMVNDALRYYALALPGMSIRLVTVKAFYSLQDTKTPVINAAITVALNIVLNIVLMRLMGHVGLALATAIASDALAILLLVSLYKKVKRFDVKHLLVTFLKTLIASLCMGIIIYSVYHFVLSQICVSFFKKVLCLCSLALIGVIVYVLMAKVLKIDTITDIVNNFVGKFREKYKQ